MRLVPVWLVFATTASVAAARAPVPAPSVAPPHRAAPLPAPSAAAAPSAAPAPAPGTGAVPASGPGLTLDAALQEAARANLDLQQSRIAVERTDAAVLGTYEGFLPRLDLSASFGRDFTAEQRVVRTIPVPDATSPTGFRYTEEVVSTPARDFPDYGLTLSVQEQLFDGLRSWGLARQARAQRRAAKAAVDEATLGVAWAVTQRFYEVVKAEQSLGVLEETAAQSRALVGSSDALFAAGRVPRDNTLTARVNLGNDLINVESQRAKVEQARTDLALVIGRQADPTLQVVPPPELSAATFARASYEPPSLDFLVAKAREARPARTRDRELVEAARQAVTAARADYFPAVGVSVTYARQGTDLTGDAGVYGPLARQYYANAQAFLRWNLFSGLGTLAQSDLARADLASARVTVEQTEQQITREVADARAALIAIARVARLAETNLASATEAVRLATGRFDAGAATQLEVRDAQIKLTQARLTVISTRSDFAVAFADLNRAVGGGL